MSRKEIQESDFTALVDSREQLPYNLEPMKMAPGSLSTGDYTVQGFENEIIVERKSLDDFLGVVGQGRERFDREIQRLLSYRSRMIVLEASMVDLEFGGWRSKVTPEAAIGSYLGWIDEGVPIVLAGRRDIAERITRRFLFISARRRYRKLCAILPHLKIAT